MQQSNDEPNHGSDGDVVLTLDGMSQDAAESYVTPSGYATSKELWTVMGFSFVRKSLEMSWVMLFY